MKKTNLLVIGICVFATVAVVGHTKAKKKISFDLQNSVHQDHRSTPKLQFNPPFFSRQNNKGEALAREFLTSRATEYGIQKDLANLELSQTKESLFGTHYHFQQTLHGHRVRGAEIIVSISNKKNKIYQVFNNTYPNNASDPKTRVLVSEEKAYDLAWSALQVRGKLTAKPNIKRQYVVSGADLQLVYVVKLSIESPHGAWELHVDATSGKVVKKVNTLLPRVKRHTVKQAKRIHGPLLKRKKAFADYKSKANLRGTRANGSGLVFDPDPRTTLQDRTLQDDSPASAFDAAYFTRSLLDITFADNKFSLIGPWVQIVDFESPSTAPSTTTDGKWTAKRGNNAFNDVMTYFHIDQNQRYMQSLGFTGNKSIQAVSIEIDSDGYQGTDNSYFSPSENRIAFGHGCVDDNEDADVILHEYGHAIHHGINQNWSGGDTGGMGEGFGDYWAASYSISAQNGSTYYPNEVFTWDAHGEGDPCWSGRVLNAFAAQYDPSKTYGAHQSIGGGFQSDELWSTPLFQAHLSLLEQGVPREEIDQIVLEAHFGLGSGLKMPEMANAIVAAAKNLQPNGNHADVFIEKFVGQQIVKLPHPKLENTELKFTDSGNNNQADPGERLVVTLPLKNTGTAGALAVSAKLSSTTQGVRVVVADSNYGDLAMGQSLNNEDPFIVDIEPSFPCGNEIDFELEITYTKGKRQTVKIPLALPTGNPIGAQLSVEPKLAIPDNDTTGITSEMQLSTPGTVGKSLKVALDLTHTYRGDLNVTLESPAGTKVLLHDQSGGSADDLNGIYPDTLSPAENFSKLENETLAGTWKLHVVDHQNDDTGTLNKWGISAISGFECQ